jgi:hypothetical protein
VALGVHPTLNILHVIKLATLKGEKRWQNFIQQKLTAMTEVCHVALDNGVPHTVIAQHYTVTQSALN